MTYIPNPIQVFDVLLQTARNLEALQEGVVTVDGSATLTDAQLPVLGFTATDHFKGGTLFFFGGGSGGSTRATRLVTAYNGTTGAITLNTSLTNLIGAEYGVMTRRYPRATLIGKMQNALAMMNEVPAEDLTLTTLANTLEYPLPIFVKRDLRQVWLARSTTAPYRWERQLRVRTEWSVTSGAPLGVAQLCFPEQPRVGYKIKLVYMAKHPLPGDETGEIAMFVPNWADSTPLSDYVSLEWLALATAVKCARWRLEGAGADEKQVTALLNDLMRQEARAWARNPQAWPQKQPMLP